MKLEVAFVANALDYMSAESHCAVVGRSLAYFRDIDIFEIQYSAVAWCRIVQT